MIGLIGKKIGMSHIFLENGSVVPVSLIQAGPCPIVQIKDESKDGYTAVQLGFGQRKRMNKPMSGHLKKAKVPSVERLFEFTTNDIKDFKVGETLDVSLFNDGDTISVTGWTKGRGFAGGIKRWGWHGGPGSHGSMSHRRIGSAGPGSFPGRIWKNKTMPGRYGNEQVTMKHLQIVKIDKKESVLYVKGAVPGSRNGYLLITKEA
ncbi:MAG: 50S ribosomal protein L3 [candidate division WOR-3 bacterium]|nr:MAG: 50S ribosomal protein L3 [candidate division WOR-3 bacterium]